MTPEPKYKIGDWLYIRQDIEAYKTDKYRKPPKLMVIGIRSDTCYAGTQINYTFRSFSNNPLFNLLEIEVTDEPLPEVN